MIECFDIRTRGQGDPRFFKRVQHSSVLKSRHSIWVRHKIADMTIHRQCMHAYSDARMLGVATGHPHALHAMMSRIAAGYPLIGVIDPDRFRISLALFDPVLDYLAPQRVRSKGLFYCGLYLSDVSGIEVLFWCALLV